MLSKYPAENEPDTKLLNARHLFRVCLAPDADRDMNALMENESSDAARDADSDAKSDFGCESPHPRTRESDLTPAFAQPSDAESDDESYVPYESSLPWAKDPGLFPGLPAFLDSGSPEHLELINEWLRLCDDGECGHPDGCAPRPSSDDRPSRLIRVGCFKGSAVTDIVQLVSMSYIANKDTHYIALSHCWGSQPNGHPPWCTTSVNVDERFAQGIPVSSLPANFQDAIHLTRALKKEYLWIDSLCILQGDREEWLSEGKKMAGVFRNAYCTIAASSAAGSPSGFLRRPRTPDNFIFVPQSSRGPVYFCEDVDDFSGDVSQAVLNSRAWVFQERALARRTIHFTERQTYWECGGGVRCESLTYMRKLVFPRLYPPEQ